MNDTSENGTNAKAIIEMIRSRYFLKPALAAIAGGLAGYLYYYFIGCASGSCAITSNPFFSILFGSASGFFLAYQPRKKE